MSATARSTLRPVARMMRQRIERGQEIGDGRIKEFHGDKAMGPI